MIVPITASVSRELFKSVPPELKEGAYGLGLTRWEMVRGVIVPYTRGGVVAAVLLGMGRAVGEAIAVTQVIGGFAGIPTRSSIRATRSPAGSRRSTRGRCRTSTWPRSSTSR